MTSDPFVPTRERVGAPFQSHAEAALASGWFPIPVKGKGQVPEGVTGSRGIVDEEKVRKSLITRAIGYDNLAVRHDGTIAIDPDVYGGKHGDETLERFRVEHGLSPLPPTFTSTARGDDSPSRQYFFRLREYVKLESKPRVDGHPADDIEICQYHHRFSVVYPSVHPDLGTTYFWYAPGAGGLTWGARLDRMPSVEELPYLPEEWVEALRKGEDTELDLDAEVTNAAELISNFRDGEPSPPVRTALDKARNQHPGHDETYSSLFNAFRYGREGHPGVKQLVALIVARHRHYLATEHPDRLAKGEVESIIRDTATKAQQMPVENPYREYSPLITLGGATVAVGPGVKGVMPEDKEDDDLPILNKAKIRTSPAQSSPGEWDAALDAGMLDGDLGGVHPMDEFVLPGWVWTQSVELAKIHKASLHRMVSPDVVLHACLATIASLVHHETTLDTGKGPTQLSYYAAAVGPSGTGKTEGLSCASKLLEQWRLGMIDQLGKDGYKRAEVGSGEGMVEAYMGEVAEFTPKLDEHGEALMDDSEDPPIPMGKWTKVRKQIRHNVMFVSDEGRQLLALASRSGSTVMSTLCSMWSGTSAGASNAKAENSRIIDEGTYVLGMLMGFQPATMDDLFDDAGGGAPQRFAFASAIHPGITDDYIEWPGELAPMLPPWAPIRMELSDKHRAEVRAYNGQKQRGEIEENPLDGHRMLLRCKTAALLALLHSQTHVSDEMWDLAKVIVDVSCHYRDELAGRAKRQAQEEAERRAAMTVKTTVASAAMVEHQQRLAAIADDIVDKIGEATGGERPRREVRNSLTPAKRALFDEAVSHLVSAGRVIEDDVLNPDTNRKVAVLRLTDSD